MKRTVKSLVFLLALAAMRGDVLACATCFGKSDSNMAAGMNAGIFALLFVIVTVLGGVASFFVYLARRAPAAVENSLPAGLPAQKLEKV